MSRFQKCLYLILRMLPRRVTGFAEKSSSPLNCTSLPTCIVVNCLVAEIETVIQTVRKNVKFLAGWSSAHCCWSVWKESDASVQPCSSLGPKHDDSRWSGECTVESNKWRDGGISGCGKYQHHGMHFFALFWIILR